VAFVLPQRTFFQWIILIGLSAVMVAGLTVARLPAGLFLGPLLAGIVLSSLGAKIHVSRVSLLSAQAVVGSMIAHTMPLSLFGELAKDWPLFLAGVVSVVAVSTTLGWLLARQRVLPGTTAIWGSSPGAATAMILMASDYDADARLVAFMQYLRIVCIVVVATVVARLYGVSPAGAAAVSWFAPVAWTSFAATAAVATVATVAGVLLHIPAGPMLLCMFAGIALQGVGWLTIELPPWFLAASYALIGWSVGLRFTREILRHAARAFPRVLASTLALIASCGVFAFILVVFAGIDPLTAYLATSPGGADSIAIISASTDVNASFVMTMQMARFLLVLIAGPYLARFVADRAKVGG
jgi:membrane AbrB-like protein